MKTVLQGSFFHSMHFSKAVKCLAAVYDGVVITAGGELAIGTI